MTENRAKLKLITNNDIVIDKTQEVKNNTASSCGYSTNPMYEKLVKFKLEQKRKRFTVEDLLKW